MDRTVSTLNSPQTQARRLASTAAVLAVAGVLTACGGGGGGTPAPTPAPSPTPTPQADCAAVTLAQDACTFDFPATKSGFSSTVPTKVLGYNDGNNGTGVCTNGVMKLQTATCVKTGPTAAELALQTKVPTPTYAVGSPHIEAFNYINRQRLACGFGLLAQSPELDKSTKAHSIYLNNRYEDGVYGGGHEETPGLSGFTGVRPADRKKAAGYLGTSGATVESAGAYGDGMDGSYVSDVGIGVLATRGLIGTVYHLANLMSFDRDIGIGIEIVRSTKNPKARWAGFNIDMGYLSNPQRSNELKSFPCEGASDVPPEFLVETPDPLAKFGLSYPAGTPIFIRAGWGKDFAFTIKSASVAPVTAGGASYSTDAGNLLALDQRNDASFGGGTSGFLVPHKPLLANTLYKVNYVITMNGVDISKSFTFATGKTDQQIMADYMVKP